MLAVIPAKGSFVDAGLVKSFRKLAFYGAVKPGRTPGHPDGWGIVSWNDAGAFYLGREPTDAWKDPKYEEVCDFIAKSKITSPLMVHLRKASVGAKTVENTHPFIIGDWAFAHNGTIRKQNLRGKTDSEWFFESLMHEKELSNGDLKRGMKRQIDSVRAVYQYSSLTFLLSDGREFYAYRDFSNGGDYYTMFYTRWKDSIVFCQERFFESEWTEVRNNQLVRLNRGNKEFSDLSQTAQVSMN